eukprot:Unigene10914_Nuclearia_a/m.33376 Unigene10914_Nuclearia_a/g.33376  ORF Unigene10914_Nuclearia_a/g.33376 Unigene10914_Nuclearia_a/m.33376 type:complete len:513 (-) Unigene10914_Nuclearia_a:216-1754(-)
MHTCPTFCGSSDVSACRIALQPSSYAGRSTARVAMRNLGSAWSPMLSSTRRTSAGSLTRAYSTSAASQRGARRSRWGCSGSRRYRFVWLASSTLAHAASTASSTMMRSFAVSAGCGASAPSPLGCCCAVARSSAVCSRRSVRATSDGSVMIPETVYAAHTRQPAATTAADTSGAKAGRSAAPSCAWYCSSSEWPSKSGSSIGANRSMITCSTGRPSRRSGSSDDVAGLNTIRMSSGSLAISTSCRAPERLAGFMCSGSAASCLISRPSRSTAKPLDVHRALSPRSTLSEYSDALTSAVLLATLAAGFAGAGASSSPSRSPSSRGPLSSAPGDAAPPGADAAAALPPPPPPPPPLSAPRAASTVRIRSSQSEGESWHVACIISCTIVRRSSQMAASVSTSISASRCSSIVSPCLCTLMASRWASWRRHATAALRTNSGPLTRSLCSTGSTAGMSTASGANRISWLTQRSASTATSGSSSRRSSSYRLRHSSRTVLDDCSSGPSAAMSSATMRP